MIKPNVKQYNKEPKIFDQQRLYNYGIWLLSKKDYSRQEIFKKMTKYQPEEKIIESVLNKLEEHSYLNDSRVISNVFKVYSQKESRSKIKNRLILKGINQDEINEFLSENSNSEKELDSAISLLNKKFKSYNVELTKKYYAFLAGKGFGWDVVSKAVSNFKNQ